MAKCMIRLDFSVHTPHILEQITFSHPLLGNSRHSVRGKSPGAFLASHSFQWTSAVQGLAVLLLKTRACFIRGYSQPIARQAILLGGAGSLASSLDYAISKQPAWMLDCFGTDSSGSSLLKRVLRITNPNRKRGGNVALAINSKALELEDICIYRGDVAVEDEGGINEIICHLAITDCLKEFLNSDVPQAA